ncbi:hypothetical protein CHUAL_001304 [Chamberlinius hualienensis]
MTVVHCCWKFFIGVFCCIDTTGGAIYLYDGIRSIINSNYKDSVIHLAIGGLIVACGWLGFTGMLKQRVLCLSIHVGMVIFEIVIDIVLLAYYWIKFSQSNSGGWIHFYDKPK